MNNKKKKQFTPLEAAKDLIRHNVLRGDALRQLRLSYMGSFNSDYHAQIGGYADGKKVGQDKIIVEKTGNKKLNPPQIFSLNKIFIEIMSEKKISEIKNETPLPRNPRNPVSRVYSVPCRRAAQRNQPDVPVSRIRNNAHGPKHPYEEKRSPERKISSASARNNKGNQGKFGRVRGSGGM